ncbi:DUF551 domain-containing protein [Cronobacter sakazakii]
MTFTKEQLIAAAHGRIDFANMMLSDNPEPLKERTWSIELELARIALSALRERAEPIYQERLFHVSGKKQIEYWAEINKGAYQYLPESERRIVYTAPPAPVVAAETFDEWSRRCEIQLTLCRPEFREVAEITWNACCAAMLAAPPAPVTAGWIACSERMPEVGDIVLTADNGGVNVGEMEHSGASYRYFTSVVSGRELPATHWMPLPEAPTKN